MIPNGGTSTAQEAKSDVILAELVDRFIDRFHAGECVDAREFAALHPKHAVQLLELLPATATMATLRRSLLRGEPLSAHFRLDSDAIGGYRIVREVGRGGMGVVYEATQVTTGRKVALKVLPISSATDPRQIERFRIEGQAAAALDHPHIVPVFDIGCEKGVHFYAMRFVEGVRSRPWSTRRAFGRDARVHSTSRGGTPCPAGGGSPGTCPRTGYRAPRCEAGKPPGRAGGPPLGRRLRPRSLHGRRRPDADGRRHRHPSLPEPRAGQRAAQARRPDGRLQPRSDPLRAGDPPPRFRRPRPPGVAPPDRLRGADPSQEARPDHSARPGNDPCLGDGQGGRRPLSLCHGARRRSPTVPRRPTHPRPTP